MIRGPFAFSQYGVTMKKVMIGLVMAMGAILIMHGNQPFVGLPLFILGIFLMMKKN